MPTNFISEMLTVQWLSSCWQSRLTLEN